MFRYILVFFQWREEMDRFCREDKERKMKYHCCEMEEGQERYECFHSSSPSAGYNVDLSTYTPTLQNASLGQICETHKLIKKKYGLQTYLCFS